MSLTDIEVDSRTWEPNRDCPCGADIKQPCSKRISTLVDRMGDFKIRQKVAFQAALRNCESKGVSVRGPSISPQRQPIYLVDGWILTESELIALPRNQSLHKEAFRKSPDNSKNSRTPERARAILGREDIDQHDSRRQPRDAAKVRVLPSRDRRKHQTSFKELRWLQTAQD